MNRRTVLTAALSAPAVALAGSLPVVAALETPVLALFREWRAATTAEDHAFDQGRPDEETAPLTKARRNIEDQLLKAPCQSATDLICKVIVRTSDGIFGLHDRNEDPAFWAEARALVA